MTECTKWPGGTALPADRSATHLTRLNRVQTMRIMQSPWRRKIISRGQLKSRLRIQPEPAPDWSTHDTLSSPRRLPHQNHQFPTSASCISPRSACIGQYATVARVGKSPLNAPLPCHSHGPHKPTGHGDRRRPPCLISAREESRSTTLAKHLSSPTAPWIANTSFKTMDSSFSI